MIKNLLRQESHLYGCLLKVSNTFRLSVGENLSSLVYKSI